MLAIVLSLRAVLPGAAHTVAMSAADVQTARSLRREHDAVLATVERIRSVADALSTQDSDLRPARRLLVVLESELLPHERDEEALLVPLVARALAGTDATAALSRTHAEIEQQVSRLRRLLASLRDDGVTHEDVVALRRLLYGLYGVVRLHNALEEEGDFSLVPTATSM